MKRVILSCLTLALAACAAQPATKSASTAPRRTACAAEAPATGSHLLTGSCRGPTSAADRQAAQDSVMRASKHGAGAAAGTR